MQLPTATPAIVETLPTGRVTPETLNRMAAIVRKYKRDANTAMVARVLTDGVSGRDGRALARRLQEWVRDGIRYVYDPRGVELLQTPPQTLKIRSGDCDDQAILLATLLESLGFSTRLIAVSENGQYYSHVMSQVLLGDRWINLETIIPGVQIGWFPSNVSRTPPPMVRHI